MCGRFAQYTPPDRLARYLDATVAAPVVSGWQPHWNIGPTSQVLGLATTPATGESDGLARRLDTYRWGLVVGSRVGGRDSGSRLFNARAETVATRASFRAAFGARRAVVPADGFYEWRRGPGKRRQPHYFRRCDGQPMALAALWEPRPDGPGGGGPAEWTRSCTIVTTGAGPDIDGIHNRMPVVLELDTLDAWLDPSTADRHALAALLRPARAGTLSHHPVGARVGNVGNDGPDLVVEMGGPAAPELPLLTGGSGVEGNQESGPGAPGHAGTGIRPGEAPALAGGEAQYDRRGHSDVGGDT